VKRRLVWKSVASPTPFARGLLLLLGVAATLLAASPRPVVWSWLAVLLPMLAASGTLRSHLRFVVFVVAPLYLLLALVWGWLVGAPPGEPLHSSPIGGIQYASLIVFRLAALGALFQLCLLPISKEHQISMLCSWGVPAPAATSVVASFALLPEMQRRASQLSVAYRARGLTAGPWWRNVTGLASLLAPLVTWSLRSAHQRAEMAWGQRPILENFQERALLAVSPRLRSGDALYLVPALVYVVLITGIHPNVL
jgi:energy-coupling factor transporter transmembrane protein EcfT